jgi:hypothetical protein
MSKKQRWKWSDSDSNEPVERTPIHTKPNTTEKTTEKKEQFEKPKTEENVEYVDNFFDDKHMRESTYERMSKREPMVQTGTNPYLQNSYIDGITIRDKYLMPYHESKPRTKMDELEA